MSLDIKAEIAQRLEVDESDLEPVFETIVQRIRQQVTHYGYARLPGLGTFRGKDGEIIFEPDAVLAETVNLRFAGLEPLSVHGMSIAKQIEKSERDMPLSGAGPSREEDQLPEERPLSEFDDEEAPKPIADGPELTEETEEPTDETPEPAAWTHPPREAPSTPIEVTPARFRTEEEAEEPHSEGAETADEEKASTEPVADEEPPEEGEVEESVWNHAEKEEVEHPLGPLPHAAYEDADFSLVDADEAEEGPLPELRFEDEEEIRDDESRASDETLEPTAKWGPVGMVAGAEDLASKDEDGASYEDPSSLEEEDDAYDQADFTEEDDAVVPPIAEDAAGVSEDDGAHVDVGAAETPAAEEKARAHAPDRDALPHEGVRRDWPSERADPENRQLESSRRNTILIGVGVIALVAAAAMAYFVTQPDDTPPAPTQAQEELAGDAESAAEIPRQDGAADAGGDGEAVPGDDAPPAASQESPPAQRPAPDTDPLRSSEGIDPSAGGFTIVVFSETSRGSANSVAERYAGEGFRAGVVQSIDDGVTRYRVGVGQFETLDEAAAARDRLAGGELPQDAWVRKFQ